MSGSEDLAVVEDAAPRVNDVLSDLGPVGSFGLPRLKYEEQSFKMFLIEFWVFDSSFFERASVERGEMKLRDSPTLLLWWYFRIESFPVTEKFNLAYFMVYLGSIA